MCVKPVKDRIPAHPNKCAKIVASLHFIWGKLQFERYVLHKNLRYATLGHIEPYTSKLMQLL